MPLACFLFVFVSQPGTAGIYLKISDTGTFSLSNRPSGEAYRLITGSRTRQDLTELDRAVQVAAGKYKLPGSLIYAVIKNKKKSDGGVMGLPRVVRSKLSDSEVRDVRTNVLAGSRYLAKMLRVFDGNLMMTLGAFSVGRKTIEKNNGVPNAQVRSWVEQVTGSFATFENRDEIIYTYEGKDGVTTIVNIRP